MSLDLSKYLGRPFIRGGRGPDAFDCYGLCMSVYKDLGINLPDINTKEEIEKNYATADSYIHLFDRLEDPKPFCLVAFYLIPEKVVSHVGIVMPDLKTMLHCCNSKRVSVESMKFWSHKFAGYYEYNEN